MKKTLLAVSLTIATFCAPLAQAQDEVNDDNRYYSFVLNSHPIVVDPTRESNHYRDDEKIATQMGFHELTTTWGSTIYKPVAFIVWDARIDSQNTQLFLRTLMHEKINLMKLYHLQNDDYNRLAAMAFGIYGNETKFGSSWKYRAKEKESVQWLISKIKAHKGRDDLNSRGGTRIKQIPALIQKAYPTITRETLDNIPDCAIATLGFLADALANLRARRLHQIRHGIAPGTVNLTYINNESIYDYIPYIYTGRMNKILNGPRGNQGATVTDNAYVLELRQHVLALSVWEYAN